jgi:hypothetical protein
MRSTRRLLLSVVLGLLGTTALFIGLVAARVVEASGDLAVRQGLDYESFLSAVDELLEDEGTEALVRFEPVEGVLTPGRTVLFDTLVIEADPSAYPSFARAGFLFDQVQAYNRFQRERLSLGLEYPEWFQRLEAFNPSVFRSYRRSDGSKGLTRAAAAWTLRVRSPLEGEWEGEIRARSVHRGAGLLGPRVTVSLRRPTRLVRAVDGRRQACEFIPGSFEIQAFCLSEQRIPQAVFRVASSDVTPHTAVAGWTDLWVDGQRVSAGDSISIERGSLLQIAPLEPVVLAEYWEGILSSKQWVNGRTRRVGTFEPPLDMFASLGERADLADEGGSTTAPVTLGVDASASAELTDILRGFAESDVDLPVDFAMVVIGRIPDGQILALGEIGDRRSRGRSNLLEPFPPGSAVKPLLAAAILSSRPELATLRLPARTGAVESVLGLPAVGDGRSFRSVLNCEYPSDGWVGLHYFLRCSNNEYAAALVTAGLWSSDRWAPEPVQGAVRTAFSLEGRRYARIRPSRGLQGRAVDRSTLLLSPLSEGLSQLFDVPTDPVITDATRRTRRVWAGLSFSDGRLVRVPYELLPTESRPALLASGSSEGTDLSLLYRYAYGAWENRWTLLDLTNGFGRLATDRRIQLTFVARQEPGDQASAVEPLGLGDHPWYPEFLSGLRAVARDGTGRGLAPAWRRVGLPSGLLAKTGTLTENGRPGLGDDLFIKSLVFAVGTESGRPGRPLSCGLVGGVVFRFSEGPASGNLPSHQVAFARQRLGAFLARHWGEFAACAGEEG